MDFQADEFFTMNSTFGAVKYMLKQRRVKHHDNVRVISVLPYDSSARGDYIV